MKDRATFNVVVFSCFVISKLLPSINKPTKTVVKPIRSSPHVNEMTTDNNHLKLDTGIEWPVCKPEITFEFSIV